MVYRHSNLSAGMGLGAAKNVSNINNNLSLGKADSIYVSKRERKRLTVAIIDQSRTKAKGCKGMSTTKKSRKNKGLTKSICSIYDKEKECETSILPIGGLEIDDESLVHGLAVESLQCILDTKSFSSANS
jgi:hypothetical protein